MARIPRIIIPDYPHHIVQRGNNRQAIFEDDQDRQEYLALVQRYKQDTECKVLSYCLMDNHVHLLIIPLKAESLSKFMQKVALKYTQYANDKYKRSGRLWECRFFSSPVETDTYLLAVCRYIERNAVRAGVVGQPEHYEWGSAKYRVSGKNPEFLDDIFPEYANREEYLEFLKLPPNSGQYEMISRSTSRGYPIGSMRFYEKVMKLTKRDLTKRPVGRPKKSD
ncbi:MAG: transposase [Candidatus Auribacterota bacterium]